MDRRTICKEARSHHGDAAQREMPQPLMHLSVPKAIPVLHVPMQFAFRPASHARGDIQA
jgi:hypothetical protein